MKTLNVKRVGGREFMVKVNGKCERKFFSLKYINVVHNKL